MSESMTSADEGVERVGLALVAALAPVGPGTTWQQGYEAARNYAHDRDQERRALARLGVEVGHIPDPPDNPYLDRPTWDF